MSHQILLMVGVDHVEPHPRLTELVDSINSLPGMRGRTSRRCQPSSTVSAATWTSIHWMSWEGEFARRAGLRASAARRIVRAHYLKQANARRQRELEQWAEPLAVMAALGGADAPHGAFAYAWRTLLHNDPHDSICGCSIDAVHDENMTRFAKVHQVIEAVADRAINILRRVPKPMDAVLRTIALNTTMARWQGVFEVDVDFPLGPAPGFNAVDYTVLDEPVPFLGEAATLASVMDADGNAVPHQVLSMADTIDFRMSRFAPPPGLHVRRMRVALDAPVPPMGYTVLDFRVDRHQRAGEDVAGNADTLGCRIVDPTTMENDNVRVACAASGDNGRR